MIASEFVTGNRSIPPSFVVFSDDWGEHMSSSQHLFRHVARQHQVIWVNTIGMRNPRISLGDLRKAFKKLSRMLSPPHAGARSSDSGLTVEICQPWMLPYGRLRGVRALNARSVARAVAAAAGGASLRGRIVVATVPNAGDYEGLLKEATVVYYCVDDFSQWPGLDADLVREMEDRLIGRADVLIGTSKSLYDRLAARGKPTHMLTHGVDLELFSRQEAVEHHCLAGIPRPRAGFFGLIDARLDQELLASVAKRMPDWSFVFAGPVELRMERLAALPNVRLTGPVAYGELPSLISGMDALIIPYAPGAFGDTLSPLKLKEYLATGKFVVSSPIAESRTQHVAIAESVDDWVHALRASRTCDVIERRRMILPSLEKETWAYKARELVRICMQARWTAEPSELRRDHGPSISSGK